MQVKIFELDNVDEGILNWTSRNAASLVVLGPEAISYFLSLESDWLPFCRY